MKLSISNNAKILDKYIYQDDNLSMLNTENYSSSGNKDENINNENFINNEIELIEEEVIKSFNFSK